MVERSDLRADLRVVADLVASGSRVLDLGCGDGALLAHLRADRGCIVAGVESDPMQFLACLDRGVPVLSLDLDAPSGGRLSLDNVADDAADIVVLSQTLQATRHPDLVLAHLMRIAPQAVVSVPNFGLWRHRVSLLVRGRMPMSRELPFPWYATPNIHLSTLPDLEALFANVGANVVRRVLLDEEHRPLRASRTGNLRAANAVYVLRRDEPVSPG